MRVDLTWRLNACAAIVVFACVLGARTALADARVTTLSGTEWPDAVAALESDVTSQGRSLALCVRDDRTYACAPCGTYTLAFDEAGTQAFRVGRCDAATGASTVTLVDRSALFDHGHAVPRPRAITVRAAIVSSIETSGGAASTGGSALGCTARIRPYLRDLEHGTDVYLGPDQYDVRVLHAQVEVNALGNGWMLASETRIDSEVDYDVIERSSGESVMTGHASLECASETRTTIDAGRAVAADGSLIAGAGFGSIAALEGVAGGLYGGSDLGSGCIGHYPSAPQQQLRIEGALSAVEIHAEGGGADLTLAVRTADGVWHCNDDGGRGPHALDPIVQLTLPPIGPVDVWIGTYGGGVSAPYRLHVVEPGVSDGLDASSLPPGTRRGPSHAPIGGLLAGGVVMQTFSWVFMAAFDLIPEMLCDRPSDCPNDAWRSVAWIPFVGPFLAETVDGAEGRTFSTPAAIDGALQDLGLLFVIISVALGQDRDSAIALGDAPDAPRLALGGHGSTTGFTLTF
jgi:hypothetical protein